MKEDEARRLLSDEIGVSRETLDVLERYAELVLRWSKRINLVSPKTFNTLWSRHFLDSAQLWTLRPERCNRWLDLGSGAGFPGLVIAAIAKGSGVPLDVSLVESDERKGIFLSTVSRELGLAATVHTVRIEALEPQRADVISARALAPLPRLLALADRHRSDGCICLFPKGRMADRELTDARRIWHLDVEELHSLTDPDARILRIGDYRLA